MIPRPQFKISIGVAVAIITVAYLVRSIVIRGGDFTPDVPGDIVAAVALVIGIVAVAWVRSSAKADDPSEDSSDGSKDSHDGMED